MGEHDMIQDAPSARKTISLGLLLVGIAGFWTGVLMWLAPDSNIPIAGMIIGLTSGAGFLLVLIGLIRWAAMRVEAGNKKT